MKLNWKTIKQTLSRQESRLLFDRLKNVDLHPREVYQPSLSGKTMGVFLVQVPEQERENAVSLLQYQDDARVKSMVD